MSLKKNFGKRLKEIRKQKHVTQFELAEAANIDEKHVGNIERGINFPRSELLEKFAEILDVEISEFFNLNHLKSKQDLINDITKKLNNCSEKEIRYFYKIIMNY